jgi:hypothetical protein
MAWRPQPLLPVPEATVAAVRAAFPKGNPYVDLRTAFGTLYDDQRVADLYAHRGCPVDVALWRLALGRALGGAPTEPETLCPTCAPSLVTSGGPLLRMS